MINAKYRGERFAWSSFADSIKAHCVDHVYLTMPDSIYKRRKKEIDTYTENFASAIARDMVQKCRGDRWSDVY